MTRDPQLYNKTLFGPEYLHDNPAVGTIYLLLMTAFCLFGTLGNMLVICAVVISKRLRSVGNTFIVNLAVADICVTAFVNPFAIVGFLNGEDYFLTRPVLCGAIANICLTSCYCSLLSIAAISINRCIHICYHDKYSVVFTKNKTIAINFILWVVSFLFEMGCFIGWSDHIYDMKSMSCVYDRLSDYSYTLFFCIVGVGIPLFVVFICYIHIFMCVRRSKIRISNDSISISNRNKTHDMRFLKTIFLIVCIFVACWIPYVTVVLYDRHDRLSQLVYTFVVMAAHMSSCLNFIVYGVTNTHFREAYFQVFHLIKERLWWQKNSVIQQYLLTEDDTSPDINQTIRSDTHRNTEYYLTTNI